MIKYIKKRDGSTQEFEAAKVNKWGEWASKTLGRYVDWSSIVLHTVSTCPETCSSDLLQERLIKTCLDQDSWSYNRMAGRLYAALLNKRFYSGRHPTVKELHNKLQELGLMKILSYSDQEYEEIERLINHKQDFKAAHFELEQVRKKYSLKNRVTGEEYETQQFVYMRMAMALAEDQPKERKLDDVKAWYEHFSNKRINAPTPNYINLGTPFNGLASCCIYKAGDSAASLAVGDHIAYTMTYMSAGIGSYLESRSLGDPVRKGAIKHQGKLPYFRALDGAVHANLQAGRGGACTTYFSAFDPEVIDITKLKNPMTTKDKQIRGLDYAMLQNKFFAKKVAKGEDIFLFNVASAPDLTKAMFSGNPDKFAETYENYEQDPSFKKKWVNAREVALSQLNESYETGKAYLVWADEMNRHTPHNDPVHTSNLCLETGLPTKEYESMADLYSYNPERVGEVAMCSLGAINVANIKDDEQYEDAAYYALLMIDKCIHKADYPLPHVGVTAKSRLNAGVGIMGMAHYLAKNKLTYSSEEGKQLINEVGERHAYYVINASLKLSKELGTAPWMNRTKWPQGWLPIDTYNRSVDGIVSSDLKYDWEPLRNKIIENGGIRNSSLMNHMPGESSSKASGTTNGIYPIRELTLMKTDLNNVVYWAAPEGERYEKWYESAWDISTKDLTDCYAIIQKWTDQSISADFYRKIIGSDAVTTKEMLTDYLYMTKMGLKTRYYVNSYTSINGKVQSLTEDEEDCESCKL